MRLLNIPFVILTFSTLLGILLGYYVIIETTTAIAGFLLSICFLGISWQYSKKMYAKKTAFTFIMITVFIFFGINLVNVHHPKNQPAHYSNQVSAEMLEKNSYGIQFHIKERLKSTPYYNKYIISIHYIGNKIVEGKILLQLPRDSTNHNLNIGDAYTTFAKIKPVAKPLNPYQFDYAKYLSNQYIYHKVTVQPHQLINTHTSLWSLLRIADQIRKKINTKLNQYSFSNKQLAIINALLLGQRQDIDQETFSKYRDAGAIHILAVSGLHVGIILLILNVILSPLDILRRKGKTIKLLLTILLLWCFAIIAGLSPSVLRAVTMFSFLAIGVQFRSKTSIYNSLFISMFLLLCFKPLLLFSVGFQLSYVAVFAIVWIQPVIAKRYQPKFYVSKKLWETFTVTIAAQLGLLPLTLFYFHQFPLLFFVSNLIIIPLLGGILGFGIVVILLAYFEILPQCIASLFGNCIDVINMIIGWIADQQHFLITGIPFSWKMLVVLHVVIIATVLVFEKYKKKRVFLLVLSTIAMVMVMISEKYRVSNLEELIVFSNQRNTTLGVLKNQRLQLYSKDRIAKKTQHFLFGNYLIQNQAILDSIIPQLKNTYRYKEQTILIIDSASIYTIKTFHPDIIILSNAPKIHLDRVINSLHPKQIIADGSNYNSYINQWKKSCIKNNIPFHYTNEKGAFILK